MRYKKKKGKVNIIEDPFSVTVTMVISPAMTQVAPASHLAVP